MDSNAGKIRVVDIINLALTSLRSEIDRSFGVDSICSSIINVIPKERQFLTSGGEKADLIDIKDIGMVDGVPLMSYLVVTTETVTSKNGNVVGKCPFIELEADASGVRCVAVYSHDDSLKADPNGKIFESQLARTTPDEDPQLALDINFAELAADPSAYESITKKLVVFSQYVAKQYYQRSKVDTTYEPLDGNYDTDEYDEEVVDRGGSLSVADVPSVIYKYVSKVLADKGNTGTLVMLDKNDYYEPLSKEDIAQLDKRANYGKVDSPKTYYTTYTYNGKPCFKIAVTPYIAKVTHSVPTAADYMAYDCKCNLCCGYNNDGGELGYQLLETLTFAKNEKKTSEILAESRITSFVNRLVLMDTIRERMIEYASSLNTNSVGVTAVSRTENEHFTSYFILEITRYASSSSRVNFIKLTLDVRHKCLVCRNSDFNDNQLLVIPIGEATQADDVADAIVSSTQFKELMSKLSQIKTNDASGQDVFDQLLARADAFDGSTDKTVVKGVKTCLPYLNMAFASYNRKFKVVTSDVPYINGYANLYLMYDRDTVGELWISFDEVYNLFKVKDKSKASQQIVNNMIRMTVMLQIGRDTVEVHPLVNLHYTEGVRQLITTQLDTESERILKKHGF